VLLPLASLSPLELMFATDLALQLLTATLALNLLANGALEPTEPLNQVMELAVISEPKLPVSMLS